MVQCVLALIAFKMLFCKAQGIVQWEAMGCWSQTCTENQLRSVLLKM